VMGPDCGTAVVGGVGLGFANVVRPGPVGLVAASGTGAQQVMSLLAWAGVGVSHCLGVGGRDLSAAVGGLSTHKAMDALDADAATELIVVIGKPPAPDVADAVRAHAKMLATPVVVAPVGLGQPDLTAAVEAVLRRLGRPVPEPWPQWLPAQASGARRPVAGRPQVDASGVESLDARASDADLGGALRGLFSGGTLCLEAMVIAAEALGPVRSNIPLRAEWAMRPDERPAGHTMIDLGDDAFTVGRPHPMIDAGPRLERITAEAADAECRVLLLDIVLGHGAHPDPADELVSVIRGALAGRPDDNLAVIASLIGTDDDPQDIRRQAMALTEAGVMVFASNAAAARHAVSLVTGGLSR
jgi:FdrA protein